MQCGVTGLVDRIDVAAQIERRGDGFQDAAFILNLPAVEHGETAAVGVGVRPHARRRHQRRRTAVHPGPRIGARSGQNEHHLDLEEFGGQQIGRGSDQRLGQLEILAQAPDGGAFRDPRARIRSMGQERLHQVQISP